jgi:hypothetical protein
MINKYFLGVSLFFNLTLVQGIQQNICINSFSVPTYPSVKYLNPYPGSFARMNLPMMHSFIIMKTVNGSKLDQKKVFNFYKNYYEHCGWTSKISNEHHLSLRTTVYETNDKHAFIYATANFRLWVAPQDGMLSIYMDQWRISKLRENSRKLYEAIETKLKKVAQERNYSVEKSLDSNYSDWEAFYQNQYLVNMKRFYLYNNLLPKAQCTISRGLIEANLLAYKNPAVAEKQAEKFRVTRQSSAIILKENIILMFSHNDVFQEKTILYMVQQFKSDNTE